MLYKRAPTRRIVLGRCGDAHSFSGKDFRKLTTTWYTINPPNVIPAVSSSGTTLFAVPGSNHVSNDGKEAEHLFEFRYILDYFNAQFTAADCAWLRQNVWNVAQPDGSPTHAALSGAIDVEANVVWADEVINDAKSFVANNDKPNANDPPLSKHIKSLSSLDPAVSGDTALKIEQMIRTFGALGQYFDANSAAIRATAERVQNVLALVTPATPAYPPLDTRFNNFFRGIMTVYTQRIRTRGVNTYNAYVARLNALLAQVIATNPPGNPAPVVPARWPVYHDATILARLNAAGINAPNFIPQAIQHPSCNTAGQSGSFVLWTELKGDKAFMPGNPVFQIEALGTRYFSLRNPSINLHDDDAALYFPGGQCTGIHFLVRRVKGSAPDPKAGPTAIWDQDCNGVNNGPALSDLHLVDANDDRQPCLFNNLNDGSGNFITVCGPSEAATRTCITHMNQVGSAPQAATSVPFFQFQAH
ncbi:hypothetical protein EYR38_006239 [Pleurotus pulmonarius]|nr:hypothetical protein EYR38_006239 [Pleurotus pulmonarius]